VTSLLGRAITNIANHALFDAKLERERERDEREREMIERER